MSTIDSIQETTVSGVKNAYYAGLGVVASVEGGATSAVKSARTQLDDLLNGTKDGFNQLVTKGESFASRSEKAIRAEINDLEGEVDDAKREASKLTDRVLNNVEEVVVSTLNRLGIPTRQEVTELNQSVEALAKKVDALRKDVRKAKKSA
ncbi:MAG: phasin family protein [Bacteroidota bacterium]